MGGDHKPRCRATRDLEHGRDRRTRGARSAAVSRHSARVLGHSRILFPGSDRGRSERQEIPGIARRRHAHRAVLRHAGNDAFGAQHVASAARPALRHGQLETRAGIQDARPQHSRRARPLDRRSADGGVACRANADLCRHPATGNRVARRPCRPELRFSEPRPV